ncbi:MAG: CBS domain-containing protein [Nocardioides sp.]|nr:CBS domain-containing protein [Nocardioidaceae bacterium]MCB8955344.1 CBS domain-containing protein [Nocardioides sp.]
MKARELVEPYPTVGLREGAVAAALLLTEQNRPGLIVVDEHDRPVAVLPAAQVLRQVIPGYLRDDPNLAGVVDQEFIDHVCDALEGKSVEEILPKERSRLPVAAADDTVLEVAAVMAADRSPLVAVVDGSSKTAPLVGVVTVGAVLRQLLPDRLRGR